jgi:hypothetical protein
MRLSPLFAACAALVPWCFAEARQSASDPRPAVEAAESSLDTRPASARPYIQKADDLLSAGELYRARALLAAGKAKVKDVDLYRRSAEYEDAFNGTAAPAWRDLATLLAGSGAASEDLLHALRRGLEVAVRDNDMDQAQWFAEKLREAGQGSLAGRYVQQGDDPNAMMVLPGGIDALGFIARAREHGSSERFLADYCRAVVDNSFGASPKASQQYLEDIGSYFHRLASIAGVGTREKDRTIVVLSLKEPVSRQNTAMVLGQLGMQLRFSGGLWVEEIPRGIRQHDVGGALGADAATISKSLARGEDFRLEIPNDPVSIWPDEKLWRHAFYDQEDMYGGLAEAVARWPRLARLYLALSILDRPTLEVLLKASSLKDLYDQNLDLLGRCSAVFSVQEGRAVVPGGDAAEPVWTDLAGTSPREPAAFFRALLRKDDGRLLAFFSTLAQLDPPHQHFFTLTASRASTFYRLFSDSAEGQELAGVTRDTSFTDFLRAVPLDSEGQVRFPGSAEVWMVAQGASHSEGGIAKLLQKVVRTAAPDREDEVLVRLARTRYRRETQGLTEMDNFLAVSRIDEHRSEPLEDQAALLLAQHYGVWSAVYPYLTTLTGVNAPQLRSFFAALEKINAPKDVTVNPVAGEFHSLIELLCLLERRGELTQVQAATLFADVSQKFAQAAGPAAIAAAGAASFREILSHCRTAGTGEVDRDIRTALLGEPHPVQAGFGESSVTLDPVGLRYHDFDRVIDMQKVPALGPLLVITDAAAVMRNGRIPESGQMQALKSAVAAVPSLTPGKQVGPGWEDADNLRRYETAGLAKLVDRIARKAAAKNPDPKEFPKLAEEMLAQAQPQFTLALSGLIYAWYLRPTDLAVSEDPLLLRKHHFYDFTKIWYVALNAGSDFHIVPQGGRSYFVGGFASFATAAGQAASVGMKPGKGVPDAVVAAQIAAVRDTDWTRLSEADQRLFNLRIQLGREWVSAAAAQPVAFLGLARQSAGLLSPARRSDLLNAVAAQSWARVWSAVTLSDLYALGLHCATVCDAGLLASPVATLLRAASSHNDGHNLDLFGPVSASLHGCSHPHLLETAPYERYERHMPWTDIAERSAEFKMQLALAADQAGISPAALGAVAEPLLRDVLSKAEMSSPDDWRSLLDSWASLGAEAVEEKFESR